MKIIKRFISILLSLSIILSIFCGIDFTAKAESNYSISIGDYITFGTYLGEPISWRCVDIDENGPLMLSDKILCLKSYDAAGTSDKYHNDGWGYIRKRSGSNCWSDSSIRQWLNTVGNVEYTHCPPNSSNVYNGYNAYDKELGFLTGFSNLELSLIKTVSQKVYVNAYETQRDGYCDGGSKELIYSLSKNEVNYNNYYHQIVTDKMFLLGPEQANAVYKNLDDYLLNAYPTSCAVNNSNYVSEYLSPEKPFDYWLNIARNEGASYENVTVITQRGQSNSGANYGTIGVRPAFYLNMDSYERYKSFNQAVYMTDFYLNNNIAIDLINVLANSETPARIIQNEFEKNKIFMSLYNTWSGIELISDLSTYSSKHGIGKVQRYESILYSMVNEITTDSIKIYLGSSFVSNCKNISSVVTKSLKLGNDKFVTNSKKNELNELVRSGKLDSALNSYSKYYSVFTSITSVTSNLEDIINTFSMYCTMNDMCESIKDIMYHIYSTSRDGELSSAAYNVYKSCESAAGRTMQIIEDTGYMITNLTTSYVADYFWMEITKTNPYLRAAYYGMKIGVTMSDILFNTSDTHEKFFVLRCINEVENSLLNSLNYYSNVYSNNPSVTLANCYISTLHLLEKVKTTACNYAVEYSKAARTDGLLLQSKDIYSKEKNAFEYCKSSFQNAFNVLGNIWCYSLEIDYPEYYEVIKAEGKYIFNSTNIVNAQIIHHGDNSTFDAYINDKKLVPGVDFTISEEIGTRGTKNITLTGCGNFYGTKKFSVLENSYDFKYEKNITLRNNMKKSKQVFMSSLLSDNNDETFEQNVIVDDFDNATIRLTANNETFFESVNGEIIKNEISVIKTRNELSFICEDNNCKLEIETNDYGLFDLIVSDYSDQTNYKGGYGLEVNNNSINANVEEVLSDSTITINGNELQNYSLSNGTKHSITVTDAETDFEAATAGQIVLLNAVVPVGYIFEGWQVEGLNYELENVDCTSFVMPDNDVTITCVYRECTHAYTEDVIEPSCIDGGYTVCFCTICKNEYIKDEVPFIGHNYVYCGSSEASCSQEGYDIYKCENCGDIENRNIKSKLEHNFVASCTIDSKCEEDGLLVEECTVCGQYNYVYIEPLGHVIQSEVVLPTCTTKGYTNNKCINCDYSYITDIVSELGHDYSNYVKTVIPTCTSNGYDVYKCIKCNATENRNIINANGHSYGTHEIYSLPTCNSKGSTVYICSVCDYNNIVEDVENLDGTALTSALDTAKTKLSKVCYSESTYNTLNQAYELHKDGCDTYTSQEVVDTATTELLEAIDNLEIIEEYSGTGKNGEIWTWRKSDECLTISGNGEMGNCTRYSVPWTDFKSLIKKVIIEDGITKIGDYSFYQTPNLVHVDISDDVKSIGKYAFCNCANLVECELPSQLESLGDLAFASSRKLQHVALPSTVKSFGVNAYSYNDGLKRLDITDFEAYLSIDMGVGSNPLYYAKNIYLNGELLTDIVIPRSVTKIGNEMFSGCQCLRSIRLHDNITSIGSEAFRENINLISIDIPDSVDSIGKNAFYCSGLETVYLGVGINSIAQGAFYNCTNLTDVYFGGSEDEWNSISIADKNESLKNATIHYNYKPKCIHSYDILSAIPATTDTNEIITYQCILCGDQYVEESYLDLADFKFKNVSLSLASSITMNFKVLKTAVADFENPYVQFTRNGNMVTVSDYTEQGDYLVFSYNDIAPQAMNDTVTAVLKAEHNSIRYSSRPLEYSVSKYAYAMLDKCSADQYAKLRTLLVDLLNYGAEAQNYQNYKTDDLVNSKLTDLQKAWASTDELNLKDVTNKNYSTVENPIAEWKSASLQLNDSVAVRYKFTAQSVDNLSVKVTCGISQWEYNNEKIINNGDGTYSLLFSDLNADKMSQDIFITIMNGDTAVSNTMRFSVESYSKKVQDLMPNTNLNKLTDAMMRYGKSAANYA